MSSYLSPDILRIALLGGIVNIHAYWTRLVNTLVPRPYLDEVFHVPQAHAYWAGNWTQWDAKITTPPGLYLFSAMLDGIKKPMTRSMEQTTADLRAGNFWLLYLLLIALYILGSFGSRQRNGGAGGEAVLPKEFNVIMFPLLFFFSGLYYTDVFSAFTVVLAHVCWSAGVQNPGSQRKWQLAHFVAGVVALATRQTNIFWVAVYLGGLQVVATANKLKGRYEVFDPAVLGAHFEGESQYSAKNEEESFG